MYPATRLWSASGQCVQSRTEGFAPLQLKTLYTTVPVLHNQPNGKHLQLHDPICLGNQLEKGGTYANFSTPFLLLNPARAVNSGWPLQLGFDATGRLSDTKFDLLGITTVTPPTLGTREPIRFVSPWRTRNVRMRMNTLMKPWRLEYFNSLTVPSVEICHVNCALPFKRRSSNR